MNADFVVLAVGTGVVAMAVAGARRACGSDRRCVDAGRQKRGAQRLSETRRDAHEAQVRAGQTERDRDTEQRGGEDLGPDR